MQTSDSTPADPDATPPKICPLVPELGRKDLVIAGIITAGMVLVAGSMTAWGPCFDDSGELQTAGAVLGIAHSPGYPGYVLLARIICMIPVFEPAALISGANLAAGAIALALLFLIQRQIGVHPAAAAITTLIVALHDRTWMSLTAPEVYAPSLLLICLSSFCALRWAAEARSFWLGVAALFLGLLVINRPPALLFVPAFLLFATLSAWKQTGNARQTARCIAGAFGWAVVPMVICVGFVLWRDRPGTPFNYIENYHQRISPVAHADGEPLSRIERALWLLSGTEHFEHLADSWPKTLVRADYLRDEFGFRGPVGFCLGLGVVTLGAIRLWRKDIPATLLIAGIFLANAAFYLSYISYGTEAYVLPALAMIAVLGGLGLTRLLERWQFRPAPVAATICATGIAVFFSSDNDWLQNARALDATKFLARADLATLPPDSVVIGTDHRVSPLQYEALVRLRRSDLDVLLATENSIAAEVTKRPNRPVYYLDRYPLPSDHTLIAERNLYRVVRPSEHTTLAIAPDPGI